MAKTRFVLARVSLHVASSIRRHLSARNHAPLMAGQHRETADGAEHRRHIKA